MHDIKSERKLGGHDGSSELTLTLPGILVDPPACSVRPNMPEERIQPGQQDYPGLVGLYPHSSPNVGPQPQYVAAIPRAYDVHPTHVHGKLTLSMMPLLCGHPDRPHFSKRMCQRCYMRSWRRQRRRPKQQEQQEQVITVPVDISAPITTESGGMHGGYPGAHPPHADVLPTFPGVHLEYPQAPPPYSPPPYMDSVPQLTNNSVPYGYIHQSTQMQQEQGSCVQPSMKGHHQLLNVIQPYSSMIASQSHLLTSAPTQHVQHKRPRAEMEAGQCGT